VANKNSPLIHDVSRNNGFLHCFAAVVFMLMLSGATQVWAQTSASSSEPHLIRLSWTEDHYALRYEVMVEKQEGGVYRNVYRKYTTELSVEISIPPGNYRCSVIPYDFLDRPGRRSEWKFVEVRGSLEPEKKGEKIAVVDPKPPKAARRLQVDGYLGLAWMPVVPVHFVESDQFFGKDPSLFGAGFRLGFVSSRRNFLNPGFELAASWHGFNIDLGEGETTFKNAAAMELNFLAQKWLSNTSPVALLFRVGAGYTVVLGGSDLTDLFQDQQCFHTNVGLSFLLLPLEHFYLEGGAGYTYFFGGELPGSLRPRLGFGWRF